MVIAVPSGITEVEKRAVEDAAHAAGAGEVFLIEEPMAAAIGVGLPVSEPAGSMIVDIGGGTCEVAIISLAGIVHSYSARQAGGDAMDDAIMSYVKRVYNLMIGERTAEAIKIQIGSAFPVGEEQTMQIKGRDIVAGLPKTLTITSEEIRDALKDTVGLIVDAVRSTLDRCEPELAADLVDRGLVLSGGSSQLKGLDKLLAAQTGLPVTVADDPLSAVAEGTGVVMNELDFLAKNLISAADQETNILVTVMGSADSNTGSQKRNQHLSEARAKYIFDLLTTKYGISPDRLTMKTEVVKNASDPALSRAVVFTF
jgi:rod shape-determining protein MreB